MTTVMRPRLRAANRIRTRPRDMRTVARRPLTVTWTAVAPAGTRSVSHRAGHCAAAGAGVPAAGASAQGIAVVPFV
jgi:hypothetical protein